MPHALPALSDIDAACRSLALATSAPELHGATCGWLAGGGGHAGNWLSEVLVDGALPSPSPGSPLDQMLQASRLQLEDRAFGFALLLPGDEASLEVRSGALFDWCRGFVGAFGLAAGADPPLSEVGREALNDLAKLAAASPQADGDDEDEDALAEIEEFVRVAALLLHGDCAMGPRHRARLN